MVLHGGAVFPRSSRAVARYDDGPILKIQLEVEDGRAVVTSLTISRADDGPPVSATEVSQLPLGAIFDDVVVKSAPAAFALLRAMNGWEDGELSLFLTEEERVQTEQAANHSRRGRPVSPEDLQRVAEILGMNRYDPRAQIRTELGVSLRTASRWIALARQQGFAKEE